MASGLPKLEQEFYAAAQAASARDKKGVVALILRDAKAAGLHEVVWESDIPAELGEANRRNVEREEEKVEELMAGFAARIDALRDFADGKTAIVGLVTSGGFNVLGNDGRCSIIGREIGFDNVGVDANIDTSTHGNEASFEFIVEKNPEYIFVMDRDAAINAEGAKLAKEIVENELVMGTDAYQNGRIVYLAHPAVWYTAEGGVTALDLMLQDLKAELLK